MKHHYNQLGNLFCVTTVTTGKDTTRDLLEMNVRGESNHSELFEIGTADGECKEVTRGVGSADVSLDLLIQSADAVQKKITCQYDAQHNVDHGQ